MANQNQQNGVKEREMFKIILKDGDQCIAGRAWLILMILMSGVIHAFVKRNQLVDAENVEDYDFLQLVDIIVDYLQQQLNDPATDPPNCKELQEFIDALKITRKSRNKLGHNLKYYDLSQYQIWTDAWLKSANFLLQDTPSYARTPKERSLDNKRIQQLTRACDALLQPGIKSRPIKEAFRFALTGGSYARAARAFFILETVIRPALVYCASTFVFKQGQERNKDIKELLGLLMNQSLCNFSNGRDKSFFLSLFFGVEGGGKPKDEDGDGVMQYRNIIAHNTQCSTRTISKYNHMVYVLKELLEQIDDAIRDPITADYTSTFEYNVKYLLDIDLV